MNKSDYIFQLCIYRGFKRDDFKNKNLKEIKEIFNSGVKNE